MSTRILVVTDTPHRALLYRRELFRSAWRASSGVGGGRSQIGEHGDEIYVDDSIYTIRVGWSWHWSPPITPDAVVVVSTDLDLLDAVRNYADLIGVEVDHVPALRPSYERADGAGDIRTAGAGEVFHEVDPRMN